MPISNQSGRDVDYEVQPSDPGVAGPILLATALGAAGTAFVGLGCLTETLGPDLTVVGLFLLVASLLSNVIAYRRVRASTAVGFTTGGTSGTLSHGQTAVHSFSPGTWVVFTEHGISNKKLATSPPVFDSTAIVTLRRCVGSDDLPDDLRTSLLTYGQDHVEVTVP